jgi:HSP20 family protein
MLQKEHPKTCHKCKGAENFSAFFPLAFRLNNPFLIIDSSSKTEVTMSIIRRNEFLPGLNMFDDLFSRDLWNWGMDNNSATNTTLPMVNIRETNDNFEVEMAAPGMAKEDFKVELDGNMLAISSEKQNHREVNDGERYTRREFSYQSFRRTFQLPKDVVDADKIEARYDNGLLKLLIPKKEEVKTKPPKTIQIS